jgi:hypothetical protein
MEGAGSAAFCKTAGGFRADCRTRQVWPLRSTQSQNMPHLIIVLQPLMDNHSAESHCVKTNLILSRISYCDPTSRVGRRYIHVHPGIVRVECGLTLNPCRQLHHRQHPRLLYHPNLLYNPINHYLRPTSAIGTRLLNTSVPSNVIPCG